ncbi:MAG TPA: hypothetical protein VGZ00_13120 [Candidatus Baltobacteraceae bacterium]|nr:hypothetical protein [Candidatus Baltobacteraceae bacterium]
MLAVLRNFINLFGSEVGQGMVEYGLIIALIAIVLMVVLSILGMNASMTLNNAANAVSSARPG